MKYLLSLKNTLALFLFISISGFAQVDVTIDANSSEFTISEYLTGLHTVYFKDEDAAYEKDDYAFARWAKDAGISTMRFPGGTVVQHWNWENPSGTSQDPWNPSFNGIYANDSLWMSLDEYLCFVEISGITPLFGANFDSGENYNLRDEGIARVVRMVNYVKDKGCGGAYWYIGNESRATNASLFKLYADAMKAADPDIKCVWNNNHITAAKVTSFLAVAGASADGVETHRKWPNFQVDGTVADWQAEYGVRPDGRNLRTFANTIRQAGIDAGYPNFMVMDNEYGTASDNNLLDFDRYTTALLIMDELQEHFIGNWDMACYWANLTWSQNDRQSLLSRENNYRRHATQYGLELLSMAEGAIMLNHIEIGGGTTTYGFSAKQGDNYLLYMLNKSNVAQDLTVRFTGDGPADKYTTTLPAMSYSRMVWGGNDVSGKVIQDTPDNFGELVDLNVGRLPQDSVCNLIIFPNDDAYVSEQNVNTNYGSDITLHYKGKVSKNHHSYLKFNVSGVSGSVESATLKLYNLQFSATDATVYAVHDTTWSEETITWSNKPNMDSVLYTINNPTANKECRFDVTSHITGNGTFSLGIQTADPDGTARLFSSKEGNHSPVLEVVLSSNYPNNVILLPDVQVAENNFLQVYPNPIKDSSSFQYNIIESSHVKLMVYDEQGKVIDILQNGFQQKGTYVKKFNGSRLTSGLFIVKLMVDPENGGKSIVETIKIRLKK